MTTAARHGGGCLLLTVRQFSPIMRDMSENPTSLAAELQRLNELRGHGALTNDEFTAAKSALIRTFSSDARHPLLDPASTTPVSATPPWSPHKKIGFYVLIFVVGTAVVIGAGLIGRKVDNVQTNGTRLYESTTGGPALFSDPYSDGFEAGQTASSAAACVVGSMNGAIAAGALEDIREDDHEDWQRDFARGCEEGFAER